jgi:hypothetical protein
VERVADLEPECVPRTEPTRRHTSRQDVVPERRRVVVGAAQLDALLAGVPGARDHDLDPVELTHRVRERQRVVDAQPLERPRALHRDQAVLVGGVAYLAAVRLAIPEPGEDGLAVRRVDDEIELPVREPVRDEIVDDPARLVREQRVLRTSVCEPVDVVREHRLQEGLRARPVHVDLSHVRHVEGAGVGADRFVLGDHALVLNRHLVARERHHARTKRDVALEERRPLQRRFHGQRL